MFQLPLKYLNWTSFTNIIASNIFTSSFEVTSTITFFSKYLQIFTHDMHRFFRIWTGERFTTFLPPFFIQQVLLLTGALVFLRSTHRVQENYTQTHREIFRHTHNHTDTHTQAHTQPHRHTHTDTHTNSHPHTHKQPHTHTNMVENTNFQHSQCIQYE